MAIFGTSTYPLRRSRHALQWGTRLYKRHYDALGAYERERLEELLGNLDQALLAKDRARASGLAEELEEFLDTRYPKTKWDSFREFAVAIVIAFAVAILIRQAAFEPMSIPTGSMRPTLMEQDLLFVSKTNFGVNVPLQAEHLYFDKELLQRTGIVIWSGHDVDLPGIDTHYFWVIPSKKAFVKRLIGKPGDSVYFYGGNVYAVDRDGNDLVELRQSEAMLPLEHIPFQQFQGRPMQGRQLLLRHMNEPLGRLTQDSAEIFDGSRWRSDDPTARTRPHSEPETYSDFLGLRNFAMSRLATKEWLQSNGIEVSGDAELYLVLTHHPALVGRERGSMTRSTMITEDSVFPLTSAHIEAIKASLYTARFVVNGETAVAYGSSRRDGGVRLPGVPNGTYEFYYGKPVRIGWFGMSSELDAMHPLRNLSAETLASLYNYGIRFNQRIGVTFRYGYFRDGALYTMGGQVAAAEDAALQNFVTAESKRAVGFKDYGPPLRADGSVDAEFVRRFGYTVPEKHYLLLGDNHALSADSRWCGPIPEDNIHGAPSYILFPQNGRGLEPAQPDYPWITVPRVLIWSILALAGLIWWVLHHRTISRPYFEPVKSGAEA